MSLFKTRNFVALGIAAAAFAFAGVETAKADRWCGPRYSRGYSYRSHYAPRYYAPVYAAPRYYAPPRYYYNNCGPRYRSGFSFSFGYNRGYRRGCW